MGRRPRFKIAAAVTRGNASRQQPDAADARTRATRLPRMRVTVWSLMAATAVISACNRVSDEAPSRRVVSLRSGFRVVVGRFAHSGTGPDTRELPSLWPAAQGEVVEWVVELVPEPQADSTHVSGR